MIVPRIHILAALISSLAHGRTEDEAVAEVAARFCLPEEAVREVVAEAEAAHG